MTSSKDSEKHFPRLHIHILKTQAKRWIENYPEALVKRILLYSYSFQLEGYMPDIIESYEPNPAIYAVVFELDEVDKTLKMTESERMEYDKKCMRWICDGKKFPGASYEKLLFATRPNLRRENFKNLPQEYLKLLTADFVNVYKWQPKDNYLEEWRFIVKFKNAELNASIRTDESHVVLWEATPQADLTTIIEADHLELQKQDKCKSNNSKVKPFPCEAGTKWEDIKITLIAEDTVRIETPQGMGRFTYHKLGMVDRRSGDKPTEVWATLKLFAKNQGIFLPKNQSVNVKELTLKAKHLNSHLKKLFEIERSIFKDHYKTHKRYETRIFFSDQTLSRETEPRQDKSFHDLEVEEISTKVGLYKE